LKAYTSNTPDQPRTAFLDRAGNIVAMADQILLNPSEALITIESKFTDRLLTHLKLYLGVSQTEARVEESLKVYFDLEGSYRPSRGEWVVPQKKGQLVLTPKGLLASVNEEEFKKFRLEHNIPLQGIDFDDQMLLCVADEEYVSYTKGCYLGQEIIARVHHRLKPPKKLVVRSENGKAAEFVFI